MRMKGIQTLLFDRVKPHFITSVEQGLKELLEKKHLYQNLRIEPPSYETIRKEIENILSGTSEPVSGIDEICKFVCSAFSKIEWNVRNPFGRRSAGVYLTPTSETKEVIVSISFTPQTVKLFCGVCERTEAYNFQYGQDLIKEFRGAKVFTELTTEQIFSLAYQCQACISIPEIFIVHRNSLKLIQSGRSPMEQIEIPSYLPKKQKKYYSDAIIAYNSGQVLAGNFLLRTFIEQFVRSISETPNSQNIETLFSKYGKDLPNDFKERFPSLQSIYDKLSDDLHGARASEDVFSHARNDIERHFNAKELFEL